MIHYNDNAKDSVYNIDVVNDKIKALTEGIDDLNVKYSSIDTALNNAIIAFQSSIDSLDTKKSEELLNALTALKDSYLDSFRTALLQVKDLSFDNDYQNWSNLQAAFDSLEANTAYLDSLKSDNIDSDTATIDVLDAGAITTDSITAGSLQTQSFEVESLSALKAELQQIQSDIINASNATISKATIDTLFPRLITISDSDDWITPQSTPNNNELLEMVVPFYNGSVYIISQDNHWGVCVQHNGVITWSNYTLDSVYRIEYSTACAKIYLLTAYPYKVICIGDKPAPLITCNIVDRADYECNITENCGAYGNFTSGGSPSMLSATILDELPESIRPQVLYVIRGDRAYLSQESTDESSGEKYIELCPLSFLMEANPLDVSVSIDYGAGEQSYNSTDYESRPLDISGAKNLSVYDDVNDTTYNFLDNEGTLQVYDTLTHSIETVGKKEMTLRGAFSAFLATGALSIVESFDHLPKMTDEKNSFMAKAGQLYFCTKEKSWYEVESIDDSTGVITYSYSSKIINDFSVSTVFSLPETLDTKTLYIIIPSLNNKDSNKAYYTDANGILYPLSLECLQLTGGTVDGKVTINDTLTVNGDIIQNGDSYETHAEQVFSKNDLIILRDNAIAPLPADSLSGLQIKIPNGDNDVFAGVNNSGEFRIGDLSTVYVYSSDGVEFYTDEEMTTPASIPLDVDVTLVEGNKYQYTLDDSRPALLRDEIDNMQDNKPLVFDKTKRIAITSDIPYLPTFTTLPDSYIDGGVVCYIGDSTPDFRRGSVYIFDATNSEWVQGSAMLVAGNGITIDDDTGAISSDVVEFHGTHDEWDALTEEEQAKYNARDFTDDVDDDDTLQEEIEELQGDVATLNAYPKIYSVYGQILTSDSAMRGHGTATVTLFANKTCRIEFSAKITTAGTNAGQINCGLSSNMLKSLNSNIPTITPVKGGVVEWYNTDGIRDKDNLGYAGILEASSGQPYWKFARMYQTSGTTGSYPETECTVGKCYIGTAYGTWA